MNQAQFLRRIAEATMDASVDELRVIATLAERIANGRKTYGPLRIAEDRRAWSREMCEEFLDAAVYSAISIVANETREADTLPPPNPHNVPGTGRIVAALCRSCFNALGYTCELTPAWLGPRNCERCGKRCEKQGPDFKVCWYEPPPRPEMPTVDDRAVPVDRLSAGTTSAPDWSSE